MGGCLSSEGKAASQTRPNQELQQQHVPAMMAQNISATPPPPASSTQLPGSTPLNFDPASSMALTKPLPEVSTPVPIRRQAEAGFEEPFDKAELIRTPAGPLESSPSVASTYSMADSPDAVAQNKTVSSLFDRAAGLDDDNDFDIPAVRTVQQQGKPYRLSPSSAATTHLEDVPLSKLRARQAGLSMGR